MLLRERNSDDRDKKKYTEDKVCQRDPYSGKNDPDDIEQKRSYARAGRCPYLLPKRKQSQQAYFKTLYSKRNSDDRQAKYNPAGHIF